MSGDPTDTRRKPVAHEVAEVLWYVMRVDIADHQAFPHREMTHGVAGKGKPCRRVHARNVRVQNLVRCRLTGGREADADDTHQRERKHSHRNRGPRYAAARHTPQSSRPEGNKIWLRPRAMRLLHGPRRRQAGEIVRESALDGRRPGDRHHRGAGHAGPTPSAPASLSRRTGRAVRLLPDRDPDFGQGAARPKPVAVAGRNRPGAGRQYMPLREPQPHPACGRACRRSASQRSLAMSAATPSQLPAVLAGNPRLDRWVGFLAPGRVRVCTGRVEIGQGVLTAMVQIGAEELDVAPDRILLQTGDTDLTPNEGYTAGSQSIQFGGVALRMACAEVRALFLDHAAASHGYSRAELAVRDGAITRRGEPTGLDYWTLAA